MHAKARIAVTARLLMNDNDQLAVFGVALRRKVSRGTRPSSAMSAFRRVPSVLPTSPRCHEASRTKAWILR
ncbi:hypothetical protein CH63R_04962 [Colletotrichum higginsianum IMI 349063]|uniref:Uncharacterized protein n=1 Tax=Colletotrichum higginsianum (strain IMI 349063) TaxID=759273 RepID=A0A1B7YKW0_COLHI|nr:hypothetical protein CH63R_04962 [Colletotrichum higginsianum IMI 349063]OBR12666.1 hypothetical protein CH63R_04962 [Colletotrichum higginsianum IMI 349063]